MIKNSELKMEKAAKEREKKRAEENRLKEDARKLRHDESMDFKNRFLEVMVGWKQAAEQQKKKKGKRRHSSSDTD